MNIVLATTAYLNDLETTLRGLRDNPYVLFIVIVAAILGVYHAFTLDKEEK